MKTFKTDTDIKICELGREKQREQTKIEQVGTKTLLKSTNTIMPQLHNP